MTHKEHQDDGDQEQGNSELSSPVVSVGVPCARVLLLQPFRPLPDLSVYGTIETDQEHHGQDVQEQ